MNEEKQAYSEIDGEEFIEMLMDGTMPKVTLKCIYNLLSENEQIEVIEVAEWLANLNASSEVLEVLRDILSSDGAQSAEDVAREIRSYHKRMDEFTKHLAVDMQQS